MKGRGEAKLGRRIVEGSLKGEPVATEYGGCLGEEGVAAGATAKEEKAVEN